MSYAPSRQGRILLAPSRFRPGLRFCRGRVSFERRFIRDHSGRGCKLRARLCTVLILAHVLLSALSALGQTEHEPQTKSESVAFLASFGCTVVPIVAGAAIIGDPDQATSTERIVGGVLGLAGWIVGPGMGHVYAGNDEAFGTGFGIRLAGTAVAIVGASSASNDGRLGWMLLGVGTLVIVGGAVADIIRAPALLHEQKRTVLHPYARRFELQFTGTGLVARLNF
jgi:hypothetical protein